MISELIHKKPLRLAYDKFSNTLPIFNESVGEDACGLLLELESQKGLFFKIFPDSKKLAFTNNSEYFVLVFTTKYLPEHIHPTIVC